MTGIHAINRLAAKLNFESIDGEDHEAVCDLFGSLQTAHSAIADVAGTLTTLDRRLDPNQFQFLLKHSIRPLVQLQVPAHLCHPGELTFAKNYLTDEEFVEQKAINNVLPRPHHPNLDKIPAKHPTRALAAAIHYQLCKKMFTKFTASQTDVADLFQVEGKKFFTSVTGREYYPSKKPTKAEKLKMSSQEGKAEQKTPAADKEDHPTPMPEVDPQMPPLEDVTLTTPKKKFRFKAPDPTTRPKHS